jgi:ribosomal protein S18 acetylase RimI-like enzyme
MNIRPANLADLNACMTIDPSSMTDHVWQVEERSRERAGEIAVAFRVVRLPREARVEYPRDTDFLMHDWQRSECFLVAEEDGQVVGYVDMTVRAWHATGWIANLVVARRYRRQGIGTALLRAAACWAKEHGLKGLMAEMQTKNYPAIRFYQKNGFTFCGFSDRYYPSHDIALFFAQELR